MRVEGVGEIDLAAIKAAYAPYTSSVLTAVKDFNQRVTTANAHYAEGAFPLLTIDRPESTSQDQWENALRESWTLSLEVNDRLDQAVETDFTYTITPTRAQYMYGPKNMSPYVVSS